MAHKTVFISYSWDSPEHSEWVLNFANDLVSNGVNVMLDQYDLSAGKDVNHFMEKSVGADKILIIMTPNYKLKADKRQGGVGFEYSIITQEYFNTQSDTVKIMPILKSGDLNTSAPTYIKSKVYHDMTDDKLYDTQLFKLRNLIYDKSPVTKPKLGDEPNFDTSEIPDIEKKLANYNKKEKIAQQKYAIINSEKGVSLFLDETHVVHTNIENNVNHYRNNHNFHLTTKANAYNKTYLVSTINFTYYFAPHYSARNSVSDAYITMNFFRGPVGFNNMSFDYDGQEEPIYKRKYLFKLDDELNPIWVNDSDSTDVLKTKDIHTLIFREVINNEIDYRSEDLR